MWSAPQLTGCGPWGGSVPACQQQDEERPFGSTRRGAATWAKGRPRAPHPPRGPAHPGVRPSPAPRRPRQPPHGALRTRDPPVKPPGAFPQTWGGRPSDARGRRARGREVSRHNGKADLGGLESPCFTTSYEATMIQTAVWARGRAARQGSGAQSPPTPSRAPRPPVPALHRDGRPPPRAKGGDSWACKPRKPSAGALSAPTTRENQLGGRGTSTRTEPARLVGKTHGEASGPAAPGFAGAPETPAAKEEAVGLDWVTRFVHQRHFPRCREDKLRTTVLQKVCKPRAWKAGLPRPRSPLTTQRTSARGSASFVSRKARTGATPHPLGPGTHTGPRQGGGTAGSRAARSA